MLGLGHIKIDEIIEIFVHIFPQKNQGFYHFLRLNPNPTRNSV